MKAHSKYPVLRLRPVKTSYGEAYDITAVTGPQQETRLGRHDSREPAQIAYEHFLATGEKPPRKPYQTGAKPRTCRVTRVQTRSGIRFVVRGAEDEVPGKRRNVYVGSFPDRAEAIHARGKFIATGEVSTQHTVLDSESRRVTFNRPRHSWVTTKTLASGLRWYVQGADYDENQKRKYIHVGVYLNPEDAEKASQHYMATGEIQRTAMELLRPSIKDHRIARIHPYTTKTGATNYCVRGEEYISGTRHRRYVGAFATEEEAQMAYENFMRDGTLASRGRGKWLLRPPQNRPRPASEKKPRAPHKPRAPRGPRVKIEDIRIVPGRNLRDHEVEALARHRPELVSVGRPKPMEAVRDQSRIRRPGEPFADWVRRITDTGVAA